MWSKAEAEYSTTLMSVLSGRIHSRRSTQFHTLYGAFAFVVGLLCIALIILIAVWRHRQHRMLMNAAARRHGGRRLISTYPQLQVCGRVVNRATVTLPPPYSEAIATPPPYCTVDSTQPVSADLESNVTSVASAAGGLVCQPILESDSLLNQQP